MESAEPRSVPDVSAAPTENALRVRKFGFGVFLLGLCTALLYVFVIYPKMSFVEPVIDLNGFGRLARNIAAGEGFSLGAGPTLRRAPFQPYFLAAFLSVFGHTGSDSQVFRPVLIVNCFLFALTCLTSFALARKAFGLRAGVVAGVLCAITPQTLRYVGMVEVETVMGLWIALAALTGWNLYREPSGKHGALFGLVVGVMTLTKAVALALPFVFVLVCAAAWRKRQPKPNLAPLGAALGVFALCLLPWIVRNHVVSGGRFRNISTNGPGEFLRGYVNAQPKYAFLKHNFGGPERGVDKWDWDANLMEHDLLTRNGMSFFSTTKGTPEDPVPHEPTMEFELQKDKIEGAEIKRRILQEPFGLIRKFVIQLFTFWYIVETRAKSLFIGAIAFTFLGLAGFGWLRARRLGIDATPILTVVVYFNVMYALILAFARYSMPVYPTLLTLSSFGIVQLFSRRRAV